MKTISSEQMQLLQGGAIQAPDLGPLDCVVFSLVYACYYIDPSNPQIYISCI